MTSSSVTGISRRLHSLRRERKLSCAAMIHATFTDDATRPGRESKQTPVDLGPDHSAAGIDTAPKRVTLEIDFADPDAIAGFLAEFSALVRARRRVRVTVE